MKILAILSLFIISYSLQARETGQTEITTDEGIEVYQKEKYYLLKKNVQIVSDRFTLNAEKVEAHFEKDLYDITDVYSEGNVILKSSDGMTVTGNEVNFNVKTEKIYIQGDKSFLQNNQFTMISDGFIKINNLSGDFELNGANSKLTTETIQITGKSIIGNFAIVDGNNTVKKLNVEDNNQVYIKTTDMDMYALKATYDKDINIIELFEKVKIIRKEEIITGDYGKINTLDKTYKIVSKNSNRVKILLNKVDE